jgi:hypothetical protein
MGEVYRFEQSQRLSHDYPGAWVERSKIPRNYWLSWPTKSTMKYRTSQELWDSLKLLAQLRWSKYVQL